MSALTAIATFYAACIVLSLAGAYWLHRKGMLYQEAEEGEE